MIRFAYIVLLLLIICNECSAVGQVNEKTDKLILAEAEANIRQWAKDRELHNLRFTGTLPASKTNPALYEFRTDDRQVFCTDLSGSEVISWRDTLYKPLSEAGGEHQRLLNEQVDDIATVFARLHFPSFDAERMELVMPGVFWRRLDNGVKDPGLLMRISVDHFNGKVYSYELRRQRNPIYISTLPKITDKEAESIALSVLMGIPAVDEAGYHGIASAFLVEGYTPSVSIVYDEIGLQHLAWSMLVVTSDRSDYTYSDYLTDKQNGRCLASRSIFVTVDALTGEVVSIGSYDFGTVFPGLHMKAEGLDAQRRKDLEKHVALYKRTGLIANGRIVSNTCYQPLLIDGQPYLYARQVASLLGRETVLETEERIVISGPQNVEFGASSAEARVGNKKVIFEKPAIGLFGRIYIPLMAVSEAFRVRATYRADTDTVCINS